MKKISLLIIILTFITLVSCSNKKAKNEVIFLGINDEIIHKINVNNKETFEYPSAPIVEGYEFISWDKEISNVNENTIIKAIYKKKIYVVNFYTFDNVLINSQNIEYGSNAIAPDNPIQEGHEFIGWDKEYNNIKSNLDIKPIYIQAKYTVKFYDELGNILSEQIIKYNNNALSPSIPNKEGYEFVGWDKDYNNVKTNLDIYPKYEKIKYTVKFYDNLNNVISEQIINYNENAIAPDLPIIDGLNFLGWDKEYNNVKTNLDIYPKYEQIKYVVKFYDDLGNVISEQIINYNEDAIEPNILIKEGYEFTGWDKEFNNVKSNLDIYPKYEQIKYVVKFYDDLGNVISEQIINYNENAIEPNIPTKEGYEFTGWDKEFNKVLSNLDIYPIFKKLYYTVTFLDMYDEIITIEQVQSNTSALLPDAPKVDYHTFEKWSLDLSDVTEDLTVKAIYKKNKETYDISDVNYWLQEMVTKYNINKPILNDEEIKEFNNKVLSSYSNTKVVDITKEPITRTNSYVYGLITNYSNINKYTIYNDTTGNAISSTEKNNILNNRNLDNIENTVNVRFGIITNFAWVRSYPTNNYSNNYSMDRFQETSLNVGEGVAIYHESLDGNWYFVQAQNYNGWVEKNNIAICTNEALVEFLNNDNKLVVISDYQIIENAHVRMGQAFPIINTNDSNHTISFPTRDSNGELLLKEVILPNNENFSIGYLEYTYKNVFLQAFKLLGIDYSWGDKNTDGRDCSSTMNGIYMSFGFMMPRNTSNQRKIPSYGISINGLSNNTLKKYKPGTMIFTSSHVMLYIGENETGTSYLLHNTTSGTGACILQTFVSYGGSKMIGILKMQ